MLIDWVTMRLPFDHLSDDQLQRFRSFGDRVARYSASTGELRWESQAWDQIRSDSHQITVRMGSDAFWVQGSPARVVGDGCAVFGTDEACKLDLIGCVRAMCLYVSNQLSESLPDYQHWLVSRIDVTGNLLLPSLSDVRVALSVLRNCEGGRYRVSQQAGDTVYWSQRSRIRKGKAYAKGPHLCYMAKKNNTYCRCYTDDEINASQRLLRLELTLGSQFIRERVGKHWSDITGYELHNEWENYFFKMIGDSDMKNETDVRQRLLIHSKTETQGKAAYGCWLLIKAEGWERARDSYSKTTWYRHVKALKNAGLGDADISSGNVVPLRRKILEAKVITNWADLLAA